MPASLRDALKASSTASLQSSVQSRTDVIASDSERIWTTYAHMSVLVDPTAKLPLSLFLAIGVASGYKRAGRRRALLAGTSTSCVLIDVDGQTDG